MRVLESISSSRSRLGRRDSIYLTVWLTVVVVTELTARGATASDSQDVLGIAAWASLIAVTALEHSRAPIRFVTAVLRTVSNLAKRLPFRPVHVSLDLRGDPPIEQGLPRTSEAALLVSLVLLIGLVMVRSSLPIGLRELLLGWSPTLWFAVLGGIWTAAIFGIGALIYQPCLAFIRRFTSSTRGVRAASLLLILGALVWCLVVVPTWLPLTLAFGCLALVILLCTARRNPGLTLVFQESDSGHPPCALDWTQLTAIRGLVLALASGCLLLLMKGDGWSETTISEIMPITDVLGRSYAWALCLSAVTMSYEVMVELASARTDDPGEPDVPSLLVLGVPEKDRDERREQIAAAGFQSVFEPANSAETDVRTHWNAMPLGPTDGYALDEKWLIDESYRRVLVREHQERCRKEFRRGLELVFRAAARECYGTGTGFWLAPHLWYFEGLKRDREDGEDRFLKPFFREAMPVASRRHFRRVLNSLELDLVFFEDGITYPRFERVLTRIFDLFDTEGGPSRAEEYHFAGVPGVLVVIHEHGFENPLRSGAFPKPDYRFLGRARILHIFRDRSGEVERLEEPGISGRVPDLLPALL